MPTRPPKLAQPWQQHDQRTGKRQRDRRLDQQRGSASARGYDAAWRRLRLRVLQEEPCCRFCERQGLTVPATEVDHIVPLRLAPERRLDRGNLQALCKPCHDRAKQRAERQLTR